MEPQPPTGDLRSQLIGNTQSDGAVFKTVLFYSVLILLLPIGSFFVTKSIIFEMILGQVTIPTFTISMTIHLLSILIDTINISTCQESTIGSNIVSAVVAVIILHLALGLFIYKVLSKESYLLTIPDNLLYRPTLTAVRRESSRIKKKPVSGCHI